MPALPFVTTMIQSPSLSVSCRPLSDHPDLAAQWQDLASRAEGSFFLTWPWIGTWLQHRPPGTDVRVLRACAGDRLVGAALVVKASRKVAGLPICEAWHLHATGHAGYDGLGVTHNDFLVDRDHGDDVRAAMIEAWAATAGRAAELHLPGLSGEGFSASLAGSLQIERRTQRTNGVALGPVRAAGLDVTDLLSSHARRFIRRSIEDYTALGPVALDEAATLPQALDFFGGLVGLHDAALADRGLPSAFAAQGVLPFHHHLIEHAWPNKAVQLLRVRAGDAVIGYLYALVHRQRVTIHSAGFYHGLLDKPGRPGLVAHALAIRHSAEAGLDHYDLMANESPYGPTLSTESAPMTWAVWKKPALRFAAERWGRHAMRQWRHWRDLLKRDQGRLVPASRVGP
jgi:CelD/BcsL family acetyltransferase involved in cellulose biosynthesis